MTLADPLITLDMDTTLIAVVELSLSSWLVAGIVPGVERQPLKKLKTDENALLALLNRWHDEAVNSPNQFSRPSSLVNLRSSPMGTGKTHIGLGLGLAACQRGHRGDRSSAANADATGLTVRWGRYLSELMPSAFRPA